MWRYSSKKCKHDPNSNAMVAVLRMMSNIAVHRWSPVVRRKRKPRTTVPYREAREMLSNRLMNGDEKGTNNIFNTNDDATITPPKTSCNPADARTEKATMPIFRAIITDSQ